VSSVTWAAVWSSRFQEKNVSYLSLGHPNAHLGPYFLVIMRVPLHRCIGHITRLRYAKTDQLDVINSKWRVRLYDVVLTDNNKFNRGHLTAWQLGMLISVLLIKEINLIIVCQRNITGYWLYRLASLTAAWSSLTLLFVNIALQFCPSAHFNQCHLANRRLS